MEEKEKNNVELLYAEYIKSCYTMQEFCESLKEKGLQQKQIVPANTLYYYFRKIEIGDNVKVLRRNNTKIEKMLKALSFESAKETSENK